MQQKETDETVHRKPGGKQETGRNCPGGDERGNRIVGRRKEKVGRIPKETFSRCNIGEARMSSSQLECSKPMSVTRVSSRGGRGRSRDKNVEGGAGTREEEESADSEGFRREGRGGWKVD